MKSFEVAAPIVAFNLLFDNIAGLKPPTLSSSEAPSEHDALPVRYTGAEGFLEGGDDDL